MPWEILTVVDASEMGIWTMHGSIGLVNNQNRKSNRRCITFGRSYFVEHEGVKGLGSKHISRKASRSKLLSQPNLHLAALSI